MILQESEEGERPWAGAAWQSQPQEVLLSQVLRHEGPPHLGQSRELAFQAGNSSSQAVVTEVSKACL